MYVVLALKVFGAQYSNSASARRDTCLPVLLRSASQVLHARVNLGSVAELSPKEALPTQWYPRYPASARSSQGESPSKEAMAREFYTHMHDEHLYDEAYTTQAMSTHDISK